MKIKIKKLKKEEKNKVEKILLVLILINLLMFIISFFTGIFNTNKIVAQIIISFVAILNFVGTIFIVLLSQKKENNISKNLEVEYNPILIEFLRNNEIKDVEKVIKAEMLYLIKKQYVKVEKIENDYLFTLKNTEDFQRMGSLEQIGREIIQNYQNENVPCYENLLVTKIIFPFENKITLSKFKQNLKGNYYKERIELCKYTLEKIIVYQLEKDGMLNAKKDYKFATLIILNIIFAFFYLVTCGVFNILLLLAVIANIAVSVIMIKNEKVLSYAFSENVEKDLEDIEDYVQTLSGKEERNEYDNILQVLYNDDSDLISFLH